MSEAFLNFKYKFPDDYNPVYANGAHGGIGPRGELVINFYMERFPLPYEERIGFDDDGNITGDIQIEPVEHDLNIIRYIQTGVVLNMDAARVLHEWLGNHLRAAKQKEGEDD